ncbi:PREDICTED: uncharacterized protein LOC108553711 [Eufriesea mexicana]|uniref:uncharacterized protein LOC108553711 n=1 Tax=Eufriesea mexicana TaxID=516756 RepID=UPI00083C6097|nr:PREDICTED: uncharacterized protein LOC108553711 [Eufriesea mexicana]
MRMKRRDTNPEISSDLSITYGCLDNRKHVGESEIRVIGICIIDILLYSFVSVLSNHARTISQRHYNSRKALRRRTIEDRSRIDLQCEQPDVLVTFFFSGLSLAL